MTSPAAVIGAAERIGAIVLRVPGAHVIVLADAPPAGPERLTVAEAATAARTSERVLRKAIREGELPAAGRQRDRSVTRAALAAWIAARSVKVTPPADADLDRRMARIAAERSEGDAP